MSSVFFQISPNNYFEAKPRDDYRFYGLRLVSFDNGTPEFIYFPDVNIDQLSVLLSIFRAKIMYNIGNINNLYDKWYNNIIVLY